jgi:hypothetical protein
MLLQQINSRRVNYYTNTARAESLGYTEAESYVNAGRDKEWASSPILLLAVGCRRERRENSHLALRCDCFVARHQDIEDS